MSSMELYQVGGTEKIRNLEEGLAKELTDLQNDIEENEMIGGSHKTASSGSLPKGTDHFRKQRELVIKRAMEVSEALPLVIQAAVMKEEMEISLQKEYTEDSLPLILHQHFCDRIQQLVQCKHMHVLRWKRFCEHTSALEALYAPYQKRLAEIMAEYSDAIARSRRLSIAHEAYLMGKVPAHNQITEEDLAIYTRWLTCHLHSVKKIHAYLRVLEWLPVSHKHESLPHPQQQHVQDAGQLDPEEDDQNLMTARTSRSQSGTVPIIQSQGRWSIFDGRMSLTETSAALSSMGRLSLADQFRQPSPLVEQSESDGASDTASVTSSSVNMGGTNTVPHTARAIAAASAAGGGPASNTDTLGIPCHATDMDRIKPVLEFLMSCYGIHANLDRINGPSDEMELLSHVNRRFKTVFARQEEQKTFPTYDKLEMGNESWGADVSNHALIKESNWLPFIKLKAKRDPKQEKMLTKLRHLGNVDELLRAQSRFFSVSDVNKVQDALKEHAVAVRDPPPVQSVSVTSHRTTLDTKNVWKQIYTSPDLYNSAGPSDDIALTDFDEKDVDNVNLSSGSRSNSALASSRRRKKEDTDEYDYASALQLLGLEEDDSSQQDPTVIQGGYLSFLQLRHLKIKDLQRTCLSILNYFRSVERTLTINDGGLSLEGKQQKRNSKQNHKQGVNDGGLGGGGGLGSHGYLHYTPAEFKLSESEFMEFSEVENHDDFYSFDEGRVHVQDQRGYYIIYKAAMEDFKQMEKDLLLIATCFIEKDRENRIGKIGLGKSSSQGRRKQSQAASDVDLPSYGHQQVDRFAVLLDLWSNETAFLENKRQLLDVYLEAYQHVFDMHEKRSLAQVITNIAYQRPRFDLKADYFVRTYRAECRCLRLHCALIKSVLDQQISDQREYIQKVCRDGEQHQTGMPFRIIPKQPVSINISRSALQYVYLLEFHPSLALASRVPQALTQAYNELVHAHQPRSVTESILIEKKILEIAQREWEHLQPIGSAFSNQIQRDLFADVYAEDPSFMCEISQSMMASLDAAAGRRTPKERKADLLKIWSRLLETITLRHRLIETANETELLSKLYKEQAADMGFDFCHLFLRCVQFEFASHKENADQPPPLFITALHEDDTNVDRYVPSSLFLAIHELDEKHVGQFSFRSKDGFLKLMKGSALENLQAVLMAQVVHKNAVLAAVQQGSVCSYFKEEVPDNGPQASGRKSPQNARSDRTSSVLTSQNATPMATTTSVIFAAKLKSSMESHKRSPEAFVSLQLEKTPSRDVMLNAFLSKKASLGTIMKNPEEVEKLKRNLIADFCRRFMRRMTQYSLRGQIIAYLNSILFLLDNFPSVRNGSFVVGMPNEKKTAMDDKKGLVTNPRDLKKRPRRLLSADGSTLLNLWFLPHHTEVLHMFKTLDEDTCARALTQCLRVIASLHDILQYLCAHSKLGSSNARLGSDKQEYVTADWGGTEGISAELREIQKQINHLDNPTDPQEVADFLSLRRDVLFLEYDATMRHSLRETFLSMGNRSAYQNSSDSIFFALAGLSNIQMPSVFSAYLPVPEPLQPRDWKASELFPWRAHLGRRGPFPLRFWQWQQIEFNMQLSMSALRDVDRHVAHGEILGVSLLMEDVLQSGQQDISMVPDDSDDEADNPKPAAGGQGKSPARSRPRSAASAKSGMSRPGSGTAKESSGQEVILKKSLSRTTEPIKAYSLLKDFLLLWKRLEVFKAEWGQRKLGQEEINAPMLYRKFCKMYKTDILYPVIRIIAKRYGEVDQYEGMVSDSEPIVAPKGASEMEIRAKQLVKLLDSLENHMIYELRRKVAREHSLVLAERSREEGNLPTDLWKKPAINERFTFAKPQIAEDFAWYLMEVGQRRDEEKTLVLSYDQLNVALASLATTIMTRERTNYENYSMFYENLLRQHHQLLYQREQEIEQLKKACKDATASALVDVQCQLADRSHELILEITALRAKIAEMRELSSTQERDLREKMKEEYDTLVHSLFQGAFSLKHKFDEFGLRLYDEAFGIVGEVRQEAMEAMRKFTPRTAEKDESGITLNQRRAVELQTLRHEKNNMSRLLLKMRALTNWRLTNMRQHYQGTADALQHEVDRCKREYLTIKMTAEEEVILLRQQLTALRKALATSDKERETVQKQLGKEMRIKQEKQHKLEQEARSARQLEAARISNLERMMDEIDDKELRLRILSEEYDRTMRLYQTTQEKARKEVHQIKNRLDHERSLKLDAFQRVDDLQTQVYDYEVAVSSMSRPYTAMTMRSKSRSTTADKRPKSHRVTSSVSASTGVWPPNTIMPPNYQQRSVTPDPWPPVANNERYDRVTQRPKTVGTRLRNRIADQLLTNLEPNHHETIMHLQTEEQQHQKYKL
ncbi:uncharacterized protein LOC119726519 isoform X2 [Patiria miniata]|uniref:DUF4549 domain-containing protein n=1 Tax=Patiria miniata TaxID=46514 RepID=A0A913ZQW7_PATMI|nr:uncharacterized protein LOC119726519 isoform X2 [Patiria miniata]